MITGKHLSRRTLLRGMGTAVALPFLDAMRPAFGATAGKTAASGASTRLAFVYVPNGIDMPNWTPVAEGANYTLPKILEPLAPSRDQLLVLTGLTQNGARPLGDGPGDHARAAASYLTGVHPKKTAGADISAGISIDQVAAQKIGNDTRFASLELACEDGRLVGNCDSGYSCAYSNSLSWRTASTPNPPEINPRMVFERMFGTGDVLTPAARAKRDRYDRSILDFVLDDAKRLEGNLGSTDKRKIDEYLYAVRDIERRIQIAEKSAPATPPVDKPAGVPVEYAEHARLMYDLLVVAFQTNMTRVATFMMAREGSGRAYREIGISDGHHPLSHHRGNPEMIAKISKINRYHMEQFGYFIDKLRSTPDGDGTLLDHSMIVYGSGISDGNAHNHNDLPVIVVGNGNGALKPGCHVKYPDNTPMTNLYVAMLDKMGVPIEKLGDSNGELKYLSDLS